jgi:hypothetical protein
VLFLASGCEEKMDYHEYVLNTYEYQMQTPDQVCALANNCYSYLNFDFGQMYDGGMLSSATDESVFNYESGKVQGFTNGGWSAANNLTSRWADDYTGIQCANYYLENCGGLTFDDYKNNGSYDVQMRRYYYSFEEVRALRAYYYYDLVRHFGDVPFFTEYLSAEQANEIGRTPALEVLDNVMAMCDEVVDTVVVDYSALSGEGWGNKETLRVNRYFVLATKARAALLAASPLFNTTGDKNRWKTAAEVCYQLIQEFGANKVAKTDYNDICASVALDASEVIFSKVDYSYFSGTIKEKYNYPVGISGNGDGGNCPSQTLVDAYEMQATGLGINEEGSGYDAANPYVGRDPRFYSTIAYNGITWPALYTNQDSLQTYVGGKSGLPTTGATPTGYYLRKNVGDVDLRSGSTVASCQHSWTLFRLGEFYLDFAECAFRYLGSATDASLGMSANDAVNVIRARAGMPNFSNDLTGTAWMKKYKNERFVELAFEGQRFFDLRRWKGDEDGIDAEHVMKSVGTMQITLNADSSFTYTRGSIARTWDNKMYLFPIDQTELLKNPALTQNEGW